MVLAERAFRLCLRAQPVAILARMGSTVVDGKTCEIGRPDASLLAWLRCELGLTGSKEAAARAHAARARCSSTTSRHWPASCGTGTNVPFAVRARLSQASGIDEAAIRVIVPPFGGGFGGKHGDEAIEAARLARGCGRPVMVHWSRAEEFQQGFLRPMAVIDVRAGLDAAGSITAWDFLDINAGANGFAFPYAVPNLRLRYEILADTAGQVQVTRIVTAYECGAVVNPDTVISQIEGGTVMALGGALFESAAFARGRVASTALSGYRVPRFTDVPELDVVLLDRPDLPSAGAGETPLIAVAPAIANAIFAATGRRLRSLPLLPDGRVR